MKKPLIKPSVDHIENSIRTIRGEKIILDADLAQLYGIETKVLVQAVKRNLGRFPTDFMFRLTQEEFGFLRSQFVTSKGRGGRRYTPYAFTEHGDQNPSRSASAQKLEEVTLLRKQRSRQS